MSEGVPQTILQQIYIFQLVNSAVLHIGGDYTKN